MRDGSGIAREARTTLARARDVADFQNRWTEFRPVALGALRNPMLTADEADTLGWMIEVMDRIGARDIQDQAP
ncbi:hypothetical protein NX862_07180 [Rhodobacter sp. KR11]|uniref:hypothetical protein n=1 Tax=Rhodobacter sp. KR11 TaxID=2974588 RepID=UPI00222232BC|nr:hypothetical protein [Rhodobacter sp. KR11]MCW1918530.1 hypothetical protein [Rhodobacter sp. KR11]